MFRNKVFQAALARNNLQAERHRLAKSPGHAAPPSAEIKKSPAGPALAQQSKVLPSSAEARVVQSAAPELRPQKRAVPGTPPPATATVSSESRDKLSGDSIGKRQRIDSLSSPSEQGAERKRREDSDRGTPVTDRDTPVTDRKPLPTPSTQMRTPYLHAQRGDDPGFCRPLLASPLSTVSASRHNTSATTQNQSPPTPIRNTPRAGNAAHVPYKSPMPQQQSLQSPFNRTQASSLSSFFNTRPAALSFSSHKKPSSPPPNEPTPLCPAPSNQQASAHQISAGFHNDGNTCYLRYYM